MANKNLEIVISAVDKATRDIKKVGNELGNFAERNKANFEKMAGFGAAATTAIGVGFNQAIDSATDLGESINAVNVVFGDGAKTIKDFGKTASRQVGLSNRAFNQLSTETGTLLKATGQNIDEVSNNTIDLTKRAADLASVFNTDVDIAMDAINQALRGETEAIRQFGSDVTDASLDTYLLSQGIERSVTEMSQQEKVLFRMEKIMADTNQVQGDFANTSDSLANQQRILSTTIEDTTARFGQLISPIKRTILEGIAPLLKRINEFIKTNPELTKQISYIVLGVTGLITVLGTLGLVIGPITAGFGALAGAIVGISAPIWLVIGAVTALSIAWKNNFGGIQDKTQEVINWLVPYINQGIGNIKNIWSNAVLDIATFWDKWGEDIKRIASNVFSFLKGLFTRSLQVLNETLQVFTNILKGNWKDAFDNLINVLKIFGEQIKEIFRIILAAFGVLLKKLLGYLGDIAKWAKSLIQEMINGIRGKIGDLMSAFSDIGGRIQKWAVDLVKEAYNWGKNLVGEMKNGITGSASKVKDSVVGVAGDIRDYLGFFSPTKKGPGSTADKWMPNLVSMLSDGLDRGRVGVAVASRRIAEAIGDGVNSLSFENIQQKLQGIQNSVKVMYSELQQNITGQKSNIKGLVDEYRKLEQQITDINTQISQLEEQGQADVAGRAVQIQDQLNELKEQQKNLDEEATQKQRQALADKRKELEAELELARQYANEEDIELARQQAERTQTQIIIDRMNQRIKEAEEEKERTRELMSLKKQEIQEEADLYYKLVEQKKLLDSEYFNLFQQQINKQQSSISRSIAMMQRLNAMSGGGGGAVDGQRALGGPVKANSSYLVGENGPELFTPSRSGSINNNPTSGASITINMGGVTVNNEADENRLIEKMKRALTNDLQMSRFGIS